MSRRSFLLSSAKVTAAIGAGLFAACKSDEKPKKRTAPVDRQLQILFASAGSDATKQADAQQAMAQAILATKTATSVDFTRGVDDVDITIRLGLTGAARPDLAVLPHASVAAGVDQTRWRVLGDVDLDPWAPIARDAARQGRQRDVVGLPLALHPRVIACNEKAFAAERVTIPTEPLSIAEFVALASRVGLARVEPTTFFFAAGGQYFDGDGKRPVIDSAKSIAAFDAMRSVATAQRAGDADALWRAGRLGMIEVASHDVMSPLMTALPFSWRAAPVPGTDDRRVPVDVDLVSVLVAEESSVALAAARRFAGGSDAARDFALALGGVPARAALRSAFEAPSPAVWSEAIARGTTAHADWVPAYGAVHGLIDAAFADVSKDGATTMKALQRSVTAALK